MLGQEEARELTNRIRNTSTNLWELVVAAYRGQAWRVLGYKDWDTYCAKEFGELRLRLPKLERREVMQSLRDQGLSLRAVGSATGYDARTVARDLTGTKTDTKVADIDTPPPEGGIKQPCSVTSVNGKTYRRKSLAENFWKTACDMAKMGARVAKLADEDGFAPSREKIKEASLRDLRRTRDALNEVIAKLEGASV